MLSASTEGVVRTRVIDEVMAKAALARLGIAVPSGRICSAAGGRPEAELPDVTGLRTPLVAKIVSADVVHKSDVGGVRTGLRDAHDVRSALHDMAAAARRHGARVDGFLIEEQVPSGWELAIGGFVDPQFGPMIMLGLGGALVELIGAVTFRLGPIDESDAREMIAETPIRLLADGFRGRPPIDVEALVGVLVRLGGANGLLGTSDPSLGGAVVEFDVNPLIASDHGVFAADASIIVDPAAATARRVCANGVGGPTDFTALLAPRSVAVIGVSSSGDGHGGHFLHALREFGYEGRIYPVHPRAREIQGLRAYRSLADLPERVDYAYVAVAAASVPGVLEQSAGRVRFAQVISSGFGETKEGRDLQAQTLATARRGGVRLLGPNCLGTHSPPGRFTFVAGASADEGSVAIVSQSGGLTVDLIRWGGVRGVRLRAAVSVGNSADVTPAELLEHFLADAETGVIGLYLEDAREGRRIFETLHGCNARTPVVVLKGGSTAAGSAAAASHTGALAGDGRAWQALAAQTGAAVVDDLGGFIDVLLAFQHLRPRPQRPTTDVVLLGNGGGASVLSADSFARAGLSLTRFGHATTERLDALALPPGTSLVNPIDTPVGTLAARDGDVVSQILDAVLEGERPGAVVMHLNVPVVTTMARSGIDVLERVVDAATVAAERYRDDVHIVLVMRSDGSAEIDAHVRRTRTRAAAAGVPVYPTVEAAAVALAAVAAHERHLGRQLEASASMNRTDRSAP